MSSPYLLIPEEIIRFEGKEEDRVEQWRTAIQESRIYSSGPDEAQINYDWNEWEGEKQRFHTLASSTSGIGSHAYRFHQAAAIHRYYVLKELLPAHGIAVY